MRIFGLILSLSKDEAAHSVSLRTDFRRQAAINCLIRDQSFFPSRPVSS
jgi:hypothetical protein